MTQKWWDQAGINVGKEASRVEEGMGDREVGTYILVVGRRGGA